MYIEDPTQVLIFTESIELRKSNNCEASRAFYLSFSLRRLSNSLIQELECYLNYTKQNFYQSFFILINYNTLIPFTDDFLKFVLHQCDTKKKLHTKLLAGPLADSHEIKGFL